MLFKKSFFSLFFFLYPTFLGRVGSGGYGQEIGPVDIIKQLKL